MQRSAGSWSEKKPNGSARIILNLSAPKGMSVNEGIDSDEFPAKMSSTEAWLAVLNKAGRGAWIAKTDWASAYKQIAVRAEDTDLQWFEWAGKFFKELCLIFGSASSAGIFDDAAKVVLDIVCRAAKFPSEMVCQHLDDICAAGNKNSTDLHRFDNTFKEIAAELGVKLAPRDDPEKSFGPCKAGTIFGIRYDTEQWVWSIPEERTQRLLSCIQQTIEKDHMTAKEIQSLAGKLINIRPLIPAGKFNIDKVMAKLAESSAKDTVAVSDGLRRQLQFWAGMLRACAGKLSIPDTKPPGSSGNINVFTDAAGGSLETRWRGTGIVLEEQWSFVAWSKAVNNGDWKVDGKKVSRKLAALELIGPLVALVAFADTCRRQNVDIWVDNSGSVAIWKKGYSNGCRLCTTLVKAISTVAAGLGCLVNIRKITRCSETGATLADLLSKGKFQQFRRTAGAQGWKLSTAPASVPDTLKAWIWRPKPDDELGHKILVELAQHKAVLGYGNKWLAQ